MATKKFYDHQCYRLAEHFLYDLKGMDDESHANELAFVIQQAIEDWIQDVQDDLRRSEEYEHEEED